MQENKDRKIRYNVFTWKSIVCYTQMDPLGIYNGKPKGRNRIKFTITETSRGSIAQPKASQEAS